MGKKIVSINSYLNSVEYKSSESNEKELMIIFEDKVSNINVIDKKVNCIVSRKITIESELEIYVDFKVNIALEERINKEEVKAMLNEDVEVLASVYSKISLIIANLTNASVFGPLVTIPVIKNKQTNIE